MYHVVSAIVHSFLRPCNFDTYTCTTSYGFILSYAPAILIHVPRRKCSFRPTPLPYVVVVVVVYVPPSYIMYTVQD